MTDTENIYRAAYVGQVADLQLREDPSGEGPSILFGHFCRFNELNEIHDPWEGRFVEQFKRGAFAKTFGERSDQVKCLFNHGRDSSTGKKAIGVPTVLREEKFGPYFEVEVLDAEYARDIAKGVEAGAYGVSFMFRVMREEIVEEPEKSKDNPEGLPERTILEVKLYELGPVTFPADEKAPIGARSMTEHFRTLDGIAPPTEGTRSASSAATLGRQESAEDSYLRRLHWLRTERLK